MKNSKHPPLDLTTLSVSELEELSGRIAARLTELRERELANAFERLDEVARSLGLDEEMLRSHFARPRRGPGPAKAPREYANPQEPAQVWSGRGKPPLGYASTWLAAGGLRN